MQSFDSIQEPRHSNIHPPRAKRHARAKLPRRPTSPLAIFQMAEYTPPPIQAPPRPPAAKPHYWIIFWKCFAVLWAAGLIVWVAMVLRYGYDLSLKSPINPIRHGTAYGFFAGTCFGVTAISLAIAFGSSPVWFAYGFCLFVLMLLGVLAFEGHVLHAHPYDCKTMGKKFPMYVTFNSEGSSAATVYIHGSPIYDMALEHIDKWTYKTYISAEHLSWDSLLGKYVQQNDPWPFETGVTSITTKLLPKAGADGTISGTCNGGRHCLEGKIWMQPNLKFHIRYTNPVTGVTTRTSLSSDEGTWYFGKDHRPLVSLHNKNGTEVFRAQSSKTVCTAGDGSLETSLVPVGLML